jgi:hypothetical protein
MILSHSIIIGIISLAAQNDHQFIAILISIGGVALTYFWWIMTTVAWDLQRYYGIAAKELTESSIADWDFYEKWENNYYNGWDFIYISALGTIGVFFIGYCIFLLRISWDTWRAGFVAVAILILFSALYIVRRFRPREHDEHAEFIKSHVNLDESESE